MSDKKNATERAFEEDPEGAIDAAIWELQDRALALCGRTTPLGRAQAEVHRLENLITPLEEKLAEAKKKRDAEAAKIRPLHDQLVKLRMASIKPPPAKPPQKKPAAKKAPEKKSAAAGAKWTGPNVVRKEFKTRKGLINALNASAPNAAALGFRKQTWGQWLATLKGANATNKELLEHVFKFEMYWRRCFDQGKRPAEAREQWLKEKPAPPLATTSKKSKVKASPTRPPTLNFLEFQYEVRRLSEGKIELHKGPVDPKMWDFFQKRHQAGITPQGAIALWHQEGHCGLDEMLEKGKTPTPKPAKRGIASFNQLKLPEADEVSQEESESLKGEKVGAS